MADDGAPAIIKVVTSIAEVTPEDWDACAGGSNPFVSHAFLSTLEESGSATAETGWLPQHVVLEDGGGRMLGCVPMYLKNHSYGEYVFDWGWADAYERAGGRYYPKVQVSVPFTPVTGPRLLLRPGTPPVAETVLVDGIERIAERLGVVTAHATFPTETQWRAFVGQGWLARSGQQYHWENKGYSDFDDFLSDLNSRKRKAIKKERREVKEADVSLEILVGTDIKSEHWDAFFKFYKSTSNRKWGEAYLTRDFFGLLGERLGDRVVLIMAKAQGRYVAGALNLIGGDAIYGRNWGCDGHFKFLHFEACYYQAIEFAIARGLRWVEAGAQGQHKIQRGYLPTKTYSAHLIRDPSFRRAVADYLDREGEQVDFEIAALSAWSPFRKSTGCN